jgi:hypothetical protein
MANINENPWEKEQYPKKNPWGDPNKKCDGNCDKCKKNSMAQHPSSQPVAPTVREALEVYRQAKLATVRAQKLELVAKKAFEEALDKEARNNG